MKALWFLSLFSFVFTLGINAQAKKVVKKSAPTKAEIPPEIERTIPEPPNQYQIRLTMENDAFGGFSDRYYTNGSRLEFHMTAGESNPTRRILGYWNDLFITSSEKTRYLQGFALGQEFYTPTNITKADVSYGDRPYSSRAYFSNSLTTATEDTSITTELEVGMIGPAVGGKSAQMNFHNLIGSPTPQGWDSQIPNSYSGALRTDVRKFHHRFFGTQYNANLGNIQTDFSFGLIFRFGNVDKTPGPGTSALQPGPPILHEDGKGYWYFYINPGGTFQLYNATIQGQIGTDKTYKNQNRNTAFSNWDNYLNNPTPEAGEREIQYRALSEDNGRNSLQRYILFNEFLVKGTNNPYNIGLNYLIFNNIFNGAEDIEQATRVFLLKNLLDQWEQIPDNARALAIYSIFRPEGGKLPPIVRLYSYEVLSQFILDPKQREILLQLLRDEIEYRDEKTYVADLKRAVGFVRAGFVSVSNAGFLFGLHYNYQTIDFQSAKGLPQQHQWIGFQLGQVF
ncbi:lipid A deacylase LpxR family protein [Leptospira noumeaensis]|uniref:Lipid A deacylase LpxR family protein n=1 Tax=Leptospira noumeaensis TaxID=2484964 RepID=A0A4R9I1L0_9LEPT|nr:lipid A deacylase LpxR family protein [Leptospira noumeaensis]TGK79129.1 lipid A deacylase LpxR family protein [Leptospira noumeaensis]